LLRLGIIRTSILDRCNAMSTLVGGTEGYADEAESLIKPYESISFADVHRPVLHLIPERPCSVVDIGAGTGRDAAYLADLGHHVVAVEPTNPLRIAGIALHTSPSIEWLDDSLPDLALLRARRETFDLVMLTSVWALTSNSAALGCRTLLPCCARVA